MRKNDTSRRNASLLGPPSFMFESIIFESNCKSMFEGFYIIQVVVPLSFLTGGWDEFSGIYTPA
jgi:hypothetical protein